MKRLFELWLLGLAIAAAMPPANADTIAVFYALDVDAKTLVQSCAKIEHLVTKGGAKAIYSQLGKHELYLLKMGSGCVETAKKAQSFLGSVKCDIVFSVGPAGEISDKSTLRRWFKVKSIVAYQSGTASSSGMMLKPTGRFSSPTIPYDFTLPQIFADAPECLLASGETFIAASDFRAEVAAETGAQLVDMNLFGLASVCTDLNVPWCAWKITSDYANEQASDDFKAFVSSYDGTGGIALAALIMDLPLSRTSLDSYKSIQNALGR